MIHLIKYMLLSFSLVCVLFSAKLNASITVDIQPTTIQAGESFNLILTLSDHTANALPDLTPLEKDFHILGTQRMMQHSYYNGQNKTVTQWIILLKPKHNGQLMIPPITVGQETTITRLIASTPKPSKVNHPNKPSEEDSFKLVGEFDNRNPFLHQQMIYTVKFYYSRPIVNISYQPPNVEDAILIPIMNGLKRSQTQMNGRVVEVEEQQYVIFPQKSGVLKINPAKLQGVVNDYSLQKIALESKSKQAEVKSIPASYTGKYWLPAKNVRLSEAYDNAANILDKGKLLKRTIYLEVQGLPGELLPKLELDNNPQADFSTHVEKPINKSVFRQDDIVGTSQIQATYLFNESGNQEIPALHLTWFNTQTGKEERVILPARKIEIRDTAVSQIKTEPVLSTPQPRLITSTSLRTSFSLLWEKTQDIFKQLKEKSIRELASFSKGKFIFGIFVLLGLMLLGLSSFLLRRTKRTVENPSILSSLSDPQGDNQETKYLHRKVYWALRHACAQNQPHAAKEALIQWMQLKGLGDVSLSFLPADFVLNPTFKAEIAYLEKALYSAKTEWSGKGLWGCVKAFNPKLGSKTEKKQYRDLPELHIL